LTFSIDHCILRKEKEKVTKTDILEVINNHYIMYIHLYYICIFSYKMFQFVLMCRYLKVHQVWRKSDTDKLVVDDTAFVLRK
jgi:hypothetical protein